MNPGPDTPDGREDRLAEILADYLEEAAAGRAGPPAGLTDRHPEFAAELEEFFAVREQLDAAVRPLRAAMAGPDRPAADEPGRLGDFRLLREVGRGGMGVVYEAEQISLGRRVALKVLPLAATLDPRQLQRFKNEALAAAALDHPHVVDVYGVGCERGTHYYAMRFVEGHSLAEVIDQLRRLGRGESGSMPESVSQAFPAGGTAPDPDAATAVLAAEASTRRSSFPPSFFRSVADVGLRVAEALDHAHRQGVIHRDIKPSNLLLDAQGKVWVADFGLARLETAESLTGSGNLLGTLRYMAPEQALGQTPADPRGDVYGLGATLYELLTRRPAVAGGDREELLRRIAEEPPAPRRLDGSIPADLETVVLKAMAKDPADRYPTAQALAEDLRRFLDDRPVLARRPGPIARLRRWARRHRPAVLAAAAGLAVLLVLAVGGLVASHWAVMRERDQTRAAERDQAKQLAITYVKEAQARRSAGLAGRRVESLDLVRKAGVIFAAHGAMDEARRLELRNEAIACLALADVRLVREWEGHPVGVSGPTFDPDLTAYLRRDQQGVVSVRRVDDDRPLQEFRAGVGMLFSPVGGLLAVQNSPDKHFRLYDWQHGRDVFKTDFPIEAMTFSPDGGRVALGQGNGTVTVHDAATGRGLTGPIGVGVAPIHLSFSPDGTRLAIASFSGRQVQVRDAATGRLQDTVPLPRGAVTVVWHPDGDLLAIGCNDRNIHIWDAGARRPHAILRGHQAGAAPVGFAAGGDLLVSWSWDWTTRLWDPWAGREVVRFGGVSPAVSRDGRRLAGEVGRNLAVWEVVPSREYRTLPWRRRADLESVELGGFSPDGRWLALGTGAGARLWDWALGKEVEVPPVPRTWDVQFHPSGDELFAGGAAGLHRLPIRQVGDVLWLGPPQLLLGSDQIGQIGLDAGGRQLVAAGQRGVWLLDLADPAGGARLVRHPGATSVAVSPGGEWAASGAHHGFGVQVWEAKTAEPVLPPLIPQEQGTQVLFSPVGPWLVSSTADEFRIWRTGSWELARPVRRQQSLFNHGAAMSPDGRVLALTLSQTAVQLSDPATGRVWAELQAPDIGPINLVGFSPDGSQLVVAAYAGDLRVWDLRRIREQLAEMGLDWDLPPYPPAAAPPTPVNRVEFVGYPRGLLPDRYVTEAGQATGRGQWAEASAELARALELDPANHRTWHDASALLVELGDGAGYRRVCTGMLSRFRRTTDANTAERTVKTCCLAPGGVADYGPVLELADRAVTGTAGHADYPWFLIARGMADYRAGNFARAADWLRKGLSPDSAAPLRDGFAYLFLSMARHRLGQADEAGRALDRARALAEKLPKPGGREALSYDWLRFQVVRREAEDLLGRKADR